MNFRRLTEEELADFAANVQALLTGPTLTAIETTVRTDLSTAIGTLSTALSTQAAAAAVAEAERKAAVTTRNETRTQIYTLLSQVRNSLKAGLAPKEHYDLCGFDFPLVRTTYSAQDPSDLSAVGFSNGTNQLRFQGNNVPGRVVYEIWRRHGDTAAWYLHATTKRQSHTDAGVTPGQYYEYKVRAVAAKSMSNFSNSAVVYGVI